MKEYCILNILSIYYLKKYLKVKDQRRDGNRLQATALHTWFEYAHLMSAAWPQLIEFTRRFTRGLELKSWICFNEIARNLGTILYYSDDVGVVFRLRGTSAQNPSSCTSIEIQVWMVCNGIVWGTVSVARSVLYTHRSSCNWLKPQIAISVSVFPLLASTQAAGPEFDWWWVLICELFCGQVLERVR